MYAIIKACGKQYRAEKGDKITLDHLDAEVGASVTFDEILLVGGDKTVVGAPTVKGASVTATVIAHEKGDKVVTFKYTRRRRHRVRRGFRHSHTIVEITGIQA